MICSGIILSLKHFIWIMCTCGKRAMRLCSPSLLISDEQWKKDPFMVGIPFSCDSSPCTEEVHLRRVCVFLKGDNWPHTSLLAAVGPAEGRNPSSPDYYWPSSRFTQLPAAQHGQAGDERGIIGRQKKNVNLEDKCAEFALLHILIQVWQR